MIERNLGARWFYERLGGVAAARVERDFGGRTLTEIGYVWRDVRTLSERAHRLID